MGSLLMIFQFLISKTNEKFNGFWNYEISFNLIEKLFFFPEITYFKKIKDLEHY